MAAVERVPVDEETGIPFLFAPHHNYKRLMHGPEGFADWNHNFFPRKHHLLFGLGGLAIRHSRVQRVVRAQHNEFHKIYERAPLPDNDTDRFKIVVPVAAGYVPDRALTFVKGEPKIVQMNREQINRLRSSEEVDIDATASDAPGNFIRNYILRKGIDYANPHDKYLLMKHSPIKSNHDQKICAGVAFDILQDAVLPASLEVMDTYNKAYDNEQLAFDAPPDVDTFLLNMAFCAPYNRYPGKAVRDIRDAIIASEEQL